MRKQVVLSEVAAAMRTGRAHRSYWLRLMASGLTCIVVAGATASAATTDYALVNGKIYAKDGWASAVAVSAGRIRAVGSTATVKKALPADAVMIDLGGKTVFPGLHDMHVHPLHAGSGHRECQFAHDANSKAVLAAVAACAQQAKAGDWIVGGRWTSSELDAGSITRATLDRISGDHPVALTDSSGHSLWVNSRALKLAGIDKATPNPEGGIIERDGGGEPSGVLRDNANVKLRSAIPPAGPQAVREELQWALSEMARNGITTLTDAMVDADSLQGYVSLADQGELKQHVRGCLLWTKDSPNFETLLAQRNSYRRETFKLDCVKIFMDGVPTESHTAAMLEPYKPTAGTPSGAPPRGLLMVPPAVLNPLVTRLDKMGVLVKFHAAGDAAVRAAMDSIAAARAANGSGGPHHEVGHLPYVDRVDMARAKLLGLTLEFSPYLWFRQPIVTDMEKAVGPERNLRAWPVKEGLATGAEVVVGSDWPVVPTVNPWIAIETLVTRKAPGGAGDTYGGQEGISLKQAIKLFTANGAREFGEPNDAGIIAPGEPADLVVVDRNPFELPITAVHEIQTLQTIVGGATVYQAAMP